MSSSHLCSSSSVAAICVVCVVSKCSEVAAIYRCGLCAKVQVQLRWHLCGIYVACVQKCKCGTIFVASPLPAIATATTAVGQSILQTHTMYLMFATSMFVTVMFATAKKKRMAQCNLHVTLCAGQCSLKIYSFTN